MTLRRLALSLAVAGLMVGIAPVASPALAQGTAAPTSYRFTLPDSVSSSASKFTVPSDLAVKKSRDGKDLGKVMLADMVVTVTNQAAKGHSVGGTITVKGKTRIMRGLPVITDDGSVKIRVVQARGTRTVTLPRGGGAATGSMISCPPGTTATYDSKAGKYVCK